MKKNFADILREEEDFRRHKLLVKLPAWHGTEGILIPSALCLEQCSSETAATHKALIMKSRGMHRVADLTGGLGVDSAAFSRYAEAVLHNEMDKTLSGAACTNAKALGIVNTAFASFPVSSERGSWYETVKEFGPDWIYIDPARRDSCGKKVFRLEDCSPDVLRLLPLMWELCDRIMVKLSPMADISLLARALGEEAAEIHVVSLKGEVKEVLCILERGHEGEHVTVMEEIAEGREWSFSFRKSEEDAASAEFVSSFKEGDILAEPCAAMLKAGFFKLPCSLFGMRKFAPSTHLYLCGDGEEKPGMFKYYRVKRVLQCNGAGMKEASKAFPKAEVIARNIPMTSEQLRTRLGTVPGGNTHIWGCSCANGKKMLLVCAKG